MPTMSSFRSKPSLTPETMLATRARVSPCRARARRSSPAREMTRTLASMLADRPLGTGWESLPFGPSALTVPLLTFTLTPAGMGMGFLPIRDMVWPLPHVGEDFAADLLLARFPIRHHASRRGDEGDPHPTQNRRDLVVGDVEAAAGGGDTHEAGDDLLVALPVLEVHPQHVLLAVFQDAEVLDEPFLLEELDDADLQLGGRDVDLLVLGPAGVADAGEQIGDGVTLHDRLTSSP